MADIALINGQAYSYVNIQVIVAGVPMPSISSISYSETQEKPNNYGTGNLPVSRGRGAREFEGSIELAMNDVEALRAVTDDGSLLSIAAFDIIIKFGTGANTKLHTLKNVEFTSDSVDTSVGDTDTKYTLDIVMANITRESL